MSENKLDIRIIRLSKWQIPKMRDVFSYNREDSTYLSIGYFDMVDVQDAACSGLDHPLQDAYRISHRRVQDISGNDSFLMENYTTQEMIVFTNIGENGFSNERIDKFWQDPSMLMFLSLIHVDNDLAEGQGDKIGEIISRISRIFGDQNYLYYFSFDYSGIVILAKGLGIQDYLDKMFKLNYENQTNEKLIRDSYSLCCFNKSLLYECFEKIDGGSFPETNDSPYWNETYSISVNIGIQNYNHYLSFLDELKDYNPDIQEYGLLGRHDVSIVNQNADLSWLIYTQYLLNKFTTGSEQWPNHILFSTHETFIKIAYTNNYLDEIQPKANMAYNIAQEQLDQRCKTLAGNLKKNEEKYNGEYIAPIEAVKYSIMSILKNRFAEDFVLCMYQSFREFIDYLIEKTSLANDDARFFDQTFNEYFRGLNSLVNSAMHSERQFIQATAFNAIIYDVPAKIMAFYMAVIQDLQKLIRSTNDKRYTFLLTPSFLNEISVKVISYKKEILPHDRILMVSINERSLYNPNEVIRRMAHEIAHYVGDELRCREKRKENLLYSVIHLILFHVFPAYFQKDKSFDDLKADISRVLTANNSQTGDDNYSKSLYLQTQAVFTGFLKNKEIEKLMKDFICGVLEKYSEADDKNYLPEYISYIAQQYFGASENLFHNLSKNEKYSYNEIQVLTNLIYADIHEEIAMLNAVSDGDQEHLLSQGQLMPSAVSKTGSGILNQVPVSYYTKIIISLYAESYADMQMILLLGMSYEKYIVGFVCEEQLDVDDFSESLEDLGRIAIVVMLMQQVGFWNKTNDFELFTEYRNDINLRRTFEKLMKIHQTVQRQVRILENAFVFEDETVWNPYREKTAKFIADTQISSEMKSGVKTHFEDISISEDRGDDLLTPLFANLLEYLLQCYVISIEHYNTKLEDIKNLKSTVSTVGNCKDITVVFSAICKEINSYRNFLFSE